MKTTFGDCAGSVRADGSSLGPCLMKALQSADSQPSSSVQDLSGIEDKAALLAGD